MILNTVRPDRQTVLFSATFPKQIERLARSILKLPLEIVVGERSMVNKDITQYVEVREEDDKFMRLLQLLGNNILLFPSFFDANFCFCFFVVFFFLCRPILIRQYSTPISSCFYSSSSSTNFSPYTVY